MRPMTTTTVVYDLGDLTSWLAVAAAVVGVVAALLIAGQDRKAARRDARQRWELEQLTRLAALSIHGGIPTNASAELKAQESERAAERLALRWVLGGPDRFPVTLRADELEADSLDQLRERRNDDDEQWWIRQQCEVVLVACPLSFLPVR